VQIPTSSMATSVNANDLQQLWSELIHRGLLYGLLDENPIATELYEKLNGGSYYQSLQQIQNEMQLDEVLHPKIEKTLLFITALMAKASESGNKNLSEKLQQHLAYGLYMLKQELNQVESKENQNLQLSTMVLLLGMIIEKEFSEDPGTVVTPTQLKEKVFQFTEVSEQDYQKLRRELNGVANSHSKISRALFYGGFPLVRDVLFLWFTGLLSTFAADLTYGESMFSDFYLKPLIWTFTNMDNAIQSLSIIYAPFILLGFIGSSYHYIFKLGAKNDESSLHSTLKFTRKKWWQRCQQVLMVNRPVHHDAE
ncbi:MAG: hypothetical protein KDD40_12835, partial [Bdellovibrionales bacterium]|nr:hypothetical protein [Bdellovibrionales bacterium]